MCRLNDKVYMKKKCLGSMFKFNVPVNCATKNWPGSIPKFSFQAQCAWFIWDTLSNAAPQWGDRLLPMLKSVRVTLTYIEKPCFVFQIPTNNFGTVTPGLTIICLSDTQKCTQISTLETHASSHQSFTLTIPSSSDSKIAWHHRRSSLLSEGKCWKGLPEKHLM